MNKSSQLLIDNTTHSHGEVEAVHSKLILPSRSEFVISAHGADGVKLEELLHDQMTLEDFRPISRFVFADKHYYESLGKAYLREDGCLLRHNEPSFRAAEISSMQATAISGGSLFPLRQEGRNIGVVYEDEYARYCRLSGVIPLDLSVSRKKQLRAVLEMLDWILITNEFQFTDTVRTWFYLDHLLDWYKEFNDIRTEFFQERGVFNKLVPASTGIGASNPWNAALTCELLAVQPKSDAVDIETVSSPLQDSALKYASSFSRAVEIRMPSHRSLLISGTASIDVDGKTQHEGDHIKQIERTLEVVSALLKSRGMAWKDVTRGIAYFVDMADRAIFDRICQDQGIIPCPIAFAHSDVCRDDLMFEIEVDAVRIS